MTEKKEKEEEKELSEFQIRNIKILTHLLESDAITDDVVEYLRKAELDYFSLIDKYRLLEEKVNIDEKTNLLKYKNDYLTNILKTASRVFYGSGSVVYNVSFIRFDIDDFAVFNNKYGHDVGDKVLIKIANLLRESSRPTDYVIRFGGEEFDILLPSTTVDGAVKYLNKIFKKMKRQSVHSGNENLKVTLSAGVSTYEYSFSEKKIINENDIKKSYKMLQIEADNALYEAKYLGKNRYCIYSSAKRDEYSKIRKLYVK
jgi:two-component system, cell cycle response regulator